MRETTTEPPRTSNHPIPAGTDRRSDDPPGPLSLTFTPENQLFAEATEEYRRLWADEGSRIVEAMQQGTGLTFIQSSITAIVYEGISMSGTRDTPMRLRASYPPDTKRSSVQ
jgi:hypothetical protein